MIYTLRRLLYALRYAWTGFRVGWRTHGMIHELAQNVTAATYDRVWAQIESRAPWQIPPIEDVRDVYL